MLEIGLSVDNYDGRLFLIFLHASPHRGLQKHIYLDRIRQKQLNIVVHSLIS